MLIEPTRLLVRQSLTSTYYCLLLKGEHVGYCTFDIYGWVQNWQLLPAAYRWTKELLNHIEKEKRSISGQHTVLPDSKAAVCSFDKCK